MENMNRSPLNPKNRTHCPHGHPYSDENVWRDKRGKRYCRTCQRNQTNEYRARMLKKGIRFSHGRTIYFTPTG